MEKKCMLCKTEARTWCESDWASLCWKCDSKVHGANFLVARHTRSLLCAICHSSTPWSASGACLSRSLALCLPCSNATNHHHHQELEQEGENQVVSFSSDSPPSSSSSTSQTAASADHELQGVDSPSLKRSRSFFFLQQEEKGERSESERMVELCRSRGRVAKRFRRSCSREECEGLDDVDSSENVSRTI